MHGSQDETWAAVTFISDGISGGWSEEKTVYFKHYIINNQLISALQKGLMRNNYFVRTHAALAFSKLKNPDHVAILREAFHFFLETDPFLCRRLLVDLCRLGDAEQHGQRIRALMTANYLSRWCAVDSIIDTIEQMGGTLLEDTERMPLIDNVRRLTRDRSVYVQRVAKYALELLDLKVCQKTLSQKAYVKYKTRLLGSNVIMFQDLDANFTAQMQTPQYTLDEVTVFLQHFYI